MNMHTMIHGSKQTREYSELEWAVSLVLVITIAGKCRIIQWPAISDDPDDRMPMRFKGTQSGTGLRYQMPKCPCWQHRTPDADGHLWYTLHSIFRVLLMIYVTRLEFLKTRDENQGYFYDGDLNFRWDGPGFWQIDRSELKQNMVK